MEFRKLIQGGENTGNNSREGKLKTVKKLLQVFVSLGLGFFVFYLVYKHLDMEEMKRIFKTARWAFLLLPIALCLFSSYLRALRWNMLIETVDHKPAMKNTFCAVMVGYFFNHILPRAGEIARCGVLKKYEKVSMSELLGTVITERSFDLLVTFLIVLFTLVCEMEVFRDVLRSISLMDKIESFASNGYVWLGLLFVVVLLLFFRKKWKDTKIAQKLVEVSKGIWNGFKSFLKVKNKMLFMFHSVMIFFVYYLMLYFSFWMFDFTSKLSMEAGLVTYVFGALGMVVPVQGGIGTYEFMTIQALELYGITATQAGAFAILAHLVEIIVNCVVGFVCFLILPYIQGKGRKEGTM